MKRSELNEILADTQSFFSKYHIQLPPFAHFSPAIWKKINPEIWREVFELKLGWDVTAFGENNFLAQGLVLFTLRNGSPNGKPYAKNYAEKIMHVRSGQVTPMHFHRCKREDIINRGGGNLIIELWNCDTSGKLTDDTIIVAIDGCQQTHMAGSQLRLVPGESICLPPGLYHSFWGEKNCTDVLVGEVSSVNDDDRDNYFLKPLARYNEIEEDVPAKWALCNEYYLFNL